ncbi:MAG: decaprenyl-phosphate phosphoribosyltransferase [Kiritimatiellae bacterium]|nr:decaprenyl-phosphate phosphoribosyltransferase [Kiritimatiellia bacterium]MDW8458168.1 decaprenyl-phosphate phosphoribosyltransferase [Verrucomicrobiota bacterium]
MSSVFLSTLEALRPKQWTKNVAVLAPVLFALGDPSQGVGLPAIARAFAGVLVFCVAASGVYVVNDLRDAQLDRLHPAKRNRPFASGALSRRFGIRLAVLLIAMSLALAPLLGAPFFATIAGYLALQAAYSFGLKELALVDVMVISIGFVLRALAGGFAAGVAISPWLLLCALLLALFLALCKRRHELVALGEREGATRPSLRSYDRQLLDVLIPMIASATLLAYCLYTFWPDTVEKFGSHKLGWTIPFVIYGLFRYLDLVYRRELGDRPEHILLTDPPLLLNLALYGALILGLLVWT